MTWILGSTMQELDVFHTVTVGRSVFFGMMYLGVTCRSSSSFNVNIPVILCEN